MKGMRQKWHASKAYARACFAPLDMPIAMVKGRSAQRIYRRWEIVGRAVRSVWKDRLANRMDVDLAMERDAKIVVCA